MKKIFNNYILPAVCLLLLAACSKDNLEAPSFKFSGRVMAAGEPAGVRASGITFELWQKGYSPVARIPVLVGADGTFSALLFKGQYKMVGARGNGPWVDPVDSVDVQIDGDKVMDFTVDPYFVIRNVSFQKNGATVTATCTVQSVNKTKTLEAVRLYLWPNMVIDQNNNSVIAAAAAPVDITKPITITATIPAALVNENYIFARVGVKTTGVAELIYSTAQKVQLK